MRYNTENITLSNGIQVCLLHRVKTPRIAINILLKGGMKSEKIVGDLRIASRLSLKGTEKYSQVELAKIIDDNALSVSHSVLADYSVLRLNCLNDKTQTALKLAKEIFLKPTFNKFDDEIAQIIGEITFTLDQPKYLCADILTKALYASHPYGNTSSLILENIQTVTKENLRENYFSYIKSQNITIVAVGDFEQIKRDDLIAELEGLFGDFAAVPHASPTPADKKIGERKNDIFVSKILKRANQAHYMTAWNTIKRGDACQPSMAVFADILGGFGLSSRLFVKLRDIEGLAYGVNSQYIPFNDNGCFQIAISTSPGNIEKAKIGFNRELKNIQDELVSDEELDRAIARITTGQLIASQTNVNIAANMSTGLMSGFGVDFTNELLDKIANVTKKEVQEAAQSITTSHSVTAIVSNNDDFIKYFQENRCKQSKKQGKIDYA